ncbi:MAG: nucleotide exchange factor GrpE [Parcubacteria group bacterium]|nr:nucleotide exchange factor GrpE [Parcubacteria group bacterium]|tara:strand:- start:281 stop:805 length:525 start_codon:yes stop_codon:yes gene_type:complete
MNKTKDTTNESSRSRTGSIKRKSKKEIEQERDEYLLGWKRALADYENLKKDQAIQKQYTRESITADLAQAYLPILDHLQSATKNTPDIPEAQEWFTGVGFIAQQCADVLKEFGVEQIDATGQFNPELHEAVKAEFDTELPDNIIIRQIQAGYTMNGKVMRPAKVIINLTKVSDQ